MVLYYLLFIIILAFHFSQKFLLPFLTNFLNEIVYYNKKRRRKGSFVIVTVFVVVACIIIEKRRNKNERNVSPSRHSLPFVSHR